MRLRRARIRIILENARMADETFRVLVVDDEKNICDLLKQAMETVDCVVDTASEYHLALDKAQAQTFNAIFLDIKMPGMNGVELLKALRQIQTTASFVMITGYAGSELVDESLSSGAFICLSKPFSIIQVLDVIRALRHEREAVKAN
jgi:DNA-binding NtrC family response regulator